MGNNQPVGLRETLRGARRVCFDTNALIYLLNGVAPYAEPLEAALGMLETQDKVAVLSVVSELELLVKPLRQGDQTEVQRIVAYLSPPFWEIVPLDRKIAHRAAAMRAATNLRLADAIVVATALEAGCQALVGNDALCAQRVREIPYLYLEDLVRA